MTQCPVCEKSGIAPEAEQCPQCQADLQCFQLLDKLTEDGSGINQSVVKENHQGKFFASLALLIIISFIAQPIYQKFFTREQTEQILPGLSEPLRAELAKNNLHQSQQFASQQKWQEQKFERLEQRMQSLAADTTDSVTSRITKQQWKTMNIHFQQLQQGVNTLQKQLDELQEQQLQSLQLKDRQAHNQAALRQSHKIPQTSDRINQNDIILYQSSKNETLWSIASRFYQNGRYYPVILQMNPGLSIYNHASFGKIKILTEQEQVMKIFKQIRQKTKSAVKVQ